jgi:thioredoxin 2
MAKKAVSKASEHKAASKAKEEASKPTGKASKVLHATDADFDAKVAAAGGPVLVDLWAPWCPPCRMLAPVLEELAAKMGGRLTIIKVDVDRSPATSDRFNVSAIPTLVLIDGKKESRKEGLQPRLALESWIEHAIGAAS